MRNNTIMSRLAKVEERIGDTHSDGPLRVYFCEGPQHMDGHGFLRGLGYDLGPKSIVVCFVSTAGDLVPRDLTPKHAPQLALSEYGS